MNADKPAPATDEALSESMQSLLQKLLEQELKQPQRNEHEGRTNNTLLGRLEGFDPEGYPIVAFAYQDTHQSRTARSIVALKREDIGRECLIQLCGGVETPVIAGLIQPPLQEGVPYRDI